MVTLSFGFWNFYLRDTNLVFYDQSQKFKGYLDYKRTHGLAKFGDKVANKSAFKMNFKLLPSIVLQVKNVCILKVHLKKNIMHENKKD